ncbi:diguanylate cyclase [Pseudoalteromonas sp. BDTF-M6]|uniref:diguanylate cyclase domain-containing protein n=1 Tax=Pseudoalteromonas sp. BDTF-M6 TaxID=2796132 RepID=UPI001BB03D29|nr:diguanylate cyclase [Pseudoalteromonas sp. BDTF-M6]MBS3798077.1 diguanylate cyclase [Pseudoalteromonas sp. BDTF-M6]
MGVTLLRFLQSLLLLAATLITSTASASITDYVVKQWNTRNGLPSQSLKSVTQDNQGYIWVGTQFGLSRFDGDHFTNFNEQNSNFLNSNAINKLLIDKEGLLWIGTKKGVSVLDPDSMNYFQFGIGGPVRDILQDDKGNIWVAANELFYIERNQIAFHLDEEQRRRSGRMQSRLTAINQISVSKMALAPQGVWLVSENYLLRLTNMSSSSSRLRLKITARVTLPERLAQTIIHDMAWLEGTLYLASELGAYFLDIDDELRPFALPNASNAAVYKFMSDSDGALWISTYGRLLYRDNSKEWQWVEPAALDQSIWFSDIYRDDQNNIWLASFSEGLWLAHAGRVERHNALSSMTEAVMALTLSPKGQLWVANRSGVGYFDQDNNFVNRIPRAKLRRSAVHDLHFVGDRLYIATDRGVLYFENEELFNIDARELRLNPVFAISEASAGGLWFGTGRGMYRLGYNGLTPFTYNAVLDSKFITFVVDKGKYGLIGTSQGGYIFSDKGIERAGDNTALESAYVTSILEIDGVGTLVGSLNDGLFYRSTKGRWHQLDVSNGLPYGSIFSLHYDKDLERVWVSTMKGVYRMPVGQFSDEIGNLQVEQVISSYDRQLDGKASQCCAGLGHDAVADNGSSIWYPSLQGVVEIPKNVQLFGQDALAPQVESIATPRRTLFTGALGKNPVLDTDERDLTISYTAIDFYAPAEVEFRYQLQGLDNDWRYANHRREAIYTNLPPGPFTFKLEAKRTSSNWQEASSAEYAFTVPRRFDETIYFRLLIVSCFFFILYLLLWVFRAQERRKQAALESLVEERTIELREANDKLNQVNSQLKLVSHSDELTGLRSRRFLFDQLPKDIEHYQRNAESLQQQGRALVLVIVNIDNFSRINDAYGPLSGDSCLQQMATLLNSCTQGSDYVARWSGDEFLLLLRDFELDQVNLFARNLCKSIANKGFLLPNGKKINLSASLGWSCYPMPLLGGQVIGWETSVNLADIALHQVKKRGGDGCAYIEFDDQLDAFEFEQSENLDEQIATLQSTSLADIKIWMR